MKKTILTLIFAIQLSNPAFASESNFNFTAFESASQTGIDHANCHSALILSGCDESSTSSPALSAGPSPILGGGIGSFILATSLLLFKSRNKK